MVIEGKDAKDFKLERFYFRFESISAPARGISQEQFMDRLTSSNLGSNVVIDLGGEVAKSPEIVDRQKWMGQNEYNDAFIKRYIYAN